MPQDYEEVEVTAPDGSVVIVNAPVGASDEQIFEFVRQNLGSPEQPAAPVAQPQPAQSQPQGGFPVANPLPARTDPFTGGNLPLQANGDPRTASERLSQGIMGSRPALDQFSDAAALAASDTTIGNSTVRFSGYIPIMRALEANGHTSQEYVNQAAAQNTEVTSPNDLYNYDRMFRDAAFEGLIPGVPSAQQFHEQERQRVLDAIASDTPYEQFQGNGTATDRNTYEYFRNLYKQTGDLSYVQTQEFSDTPENRDAYDQNLEGFRQGFDQGLYNDYGDYIREVQARSQNDGIAPWLAGSLAGGLIDPTNAAPNGAGVVRSALGNAAIEAVVSPLLNEQRRQRGQDEMTNTEIATNIGFAGALGGILEAPHAIADRAAARTRVQASPEVAVAPTVSRPRTRRSNAQGGRYASEIATTVQEASDFVAHVTRDWTNAPDVEVRRNFNDLDGVDNDAIGVFNADSGKVSVNMEAVLAEANRRKLAPEDVLSAVTFHEGLGHNGMTQLFGERLDDTLWSFYDKGTASFRRRVDEWVTANPEAYKGDPNLTARAVEEILAEWSERGPLPRPIFDRLANTVKDFGRRIGVDISYSEREVRSILGMAHSAVTNGMGRDVTGNGFRYMYAGRRAETANDYTLRNAQLEAARGNNVGPDSETRQRTGWFRGPDGQWRFEISDENASLNILTMRDNNFSPTTLGDVMSHSDLFDAYPRLRDMKVEFSSGSSRNLGEFNEMTRTITVNRNLRPRKMLSTLIHETQHAVQSTENFARGGNIDTALHQASDDVIMRGAQRWADDLETLSKRAEDRYDLMVELSDAPGLEELRSAVRNEADLYRGGKNASLEELDAASQRVSDAYEAFYRAQGLDYRKDVIFNKRNHDIASAIDRYLVKSDNIDKGLDSLIRDVEDMRKRSISVKEKIYDNDIKGLRSYFSSVDTAKFESYQHLFGEVEARDTQNRVGMSAGERQMNAPYTSEKFVDPENYIMRGQEFGPMSSSRDRAEIEKKDRRLPDPNVRYMRPSKDTSELDGEEITDPSKLQHILDSMLEGYEHTPRTQEEVMRIARARGFTAREVKKFSTQELDVRMYQVDQILGQMRDKLSTLYDRMDVNGFGGKAKGDFLAASFKTKALLEQALGNSAEVGRALAIHKQLQFTRRNLSNLNELLTEMQGNNVSGFADEATFQRYATQIQALLSNGNVAGAAAMTRKITKPYWWQYILTYRHAAMLSGIGTHAKNFSDSAYMITRVIEEKGLAAIGEYAVRRPLRALGQSVDQGVSLSELLAHGYGLTKALLDNQTWKDTWDAFKNGHGNRQYSARIEMHDARFSDVIGPVGKGIDAVNDALFAMDTMFRAFHTNAHLYALGVRDAHKQGFHGRAAFEEGTNIAANASNEMIRQANKMTDEILLVDSPSWISSKIETAKAIRPGMKAGEQAGAFFANLLFPFLRVTDRLLWQALRRSPFFIFDKNTRVDLAAGGARRDIAISRALMGTAIAAYYWEAAGGSKDQQDNSIQGAGPSDYAKRQALEGGGFRPNSVIEDGSYVDASALNLSFLPWGLDNNVAASVATLRERYESGIAEDGEVASGLMASARAFAELLGSQTYAENFSPIVSLFSPSSEGGADNKWSDFTGDLASQLVPAALRQYNQQVNDPIRRVTTGDGSASDRIYGRVASGVPGLSDNLPARRSVYGDEMPQGRSTLGMSNHTEILTDDVSRELSQVERANTETVVDPAPSTFQFENQDLHLTAEERQTWQYARGYYLRQIMSEWVGSPEWRGMSIEDKTKVVEDSQKEANQYAREDMIQYLGLTESEK